MYIDYLNIPAIPKEILEDLDTIRNRLFAIGTPYNGTFRLKDTSSTVSDYIQTLFPFEVHCRYQFVYQGLPIHTDMKGNAGRKLAVNYLLNAGGNNVITNIYDNNYNVIDSKCLELNRWHYIRTDHLHNVSNIDKDSVRIALSIGLNEDIEDFIHQFSLK